VKKQVELFLGWLTILALVGGLLASCAPAATGTPAPPAEATEPPTQATAPPAEATEPPAEAVTGPKRGGTLIWTSNEIVLDFDPVWMEHNPSLWIYQNCFEPLARINQEGTALEPALAESWDVSEDGTVYTFHLRPDVRFHNGDYLKASDVKWSLDRARQPNAGVYSWTLSDIKEIEVVDESTVEITLNAPSASFVAALGVFNAVILPQSAFEEMGDEFRYKTPIGTGPFQVTEFLGGDYVLFTKNPYYWQLGADGEPLPYLDAVKLVQVPEDTTRVMKVQAGEADGTDWVPFSMVSELQADPNVQMKLFPAAFVHTADLNHTHPPMDDMKVRQAMNYAVNRQAMIDVVCFGHGTAATSLRPSSGHCFDPELEGYTYDLEKAKQLMAESSYPDGFSGLKLDILAGRALHKDIATILQAGWAEIGIEAELNPLEAALYDDHYQKETFDVWVAQWSDDMLDARQQMEYMGVFPASHSGWDVPPRMVELAEAANLSLDNEERCGYYAEMQRIYNEESVGLMLFEAPYATLLGKDVRDFIQIPFGWLTWRETWLDSG